MAELPDKPHAADVPESLRDAIEPLMRKLEGLWRYLAEQAEQEDATQEVADLGRHIRQLEMRFNTMRGDGNVLVRTGAAGATFSLAPQQEEPHIFPADKGFPAEIATEVSGGEYTFKEKVLTDGTTWADKTGGRTGTCYEINDVTGIAVGKIILVAVRHDTSGNLRYIFDHSGSAASTRIVKIVSYAAGVYVVQPVVRADDAWANDGSQLTGIHNHGEVQTDEAGYLAGPAGQDIYVPLFTAGDESFILVHPPRMV